MAGRLVTSLEYINRPNPVEPTAAPPKHPFHGSSHLHSQDLGRLLLEGHGREASGQASAKRKRVDGGNSQARDLPRLPSRPGDGRRTRLPPTLSGLHQPPPNARLLPSIQVQQPPKPSVNPPSSVAEANASSSSAPTCSKGRAAVSSTSSNASKTIRNKWSEKETADLLRGAARFGVGSWTKILKCEEYHFDRRTAIDLKDRFRVCCPDRYGKPASSIDVAAHREQAGVASMNKPRNARSERKDDADLARLGIDTPLVKNARRSRHGYTDAEDNALLTGFKKYGKSWALIRQDKALGLSHRRPTDLRDRFRQRYPQEYAATGLAARPEVFPPAADRGHRADDVATSSAATIQHRHAEPPSMIQQSKGSREPESVQPLQLLPRDDADFTISLFPFEDDLFGDNELDGEPVVLDRDILDWALENTRTKPLDNARRPDDNVTQGGTDPPLRQPPIALGDQNSANPTLPSVAAITAWNEDDLQLELPSMNDYFNSLLGDGRAASGMGFPSLEELGG